MPKILTAETVPGTAVWTDASELTAGVTSIVYRPAGPQNVTLGIYTSFDDAFAAAQVLATSTQRPTRLYLEDPPVGGPLTLAAVDYDFLNLIIPTGFANTPNNSFIIETVEGTTFSNFTLGGENIEIYHTGTATALITVDPGAGLTLPHQLGPNSSVFAENSAAPAYDFVGAPGKIVDFKLLENSAISGVGAAAFRTVIDGTIQVAAGGVIAPETLSSNGVPGGALNIDPSGNFDWSAFQPEFLGEISVQTDMRYDTTLGAAPPGSGVDVTNPPGPEWGRVFGTFTLAATGANPASWVIAVQASPGAGYTTIGTFTQVATDTLARTYWFYFEVASGCNFRFTSGGLAGVTETISRYSAILNKNTV